MPPDYARLYFVIMPFGKEEVMDSAGAKRKVNFDRIYDSLFEPAINAVRLPEGGTLTAHRTDPDFFAGSISQDMCEYLEYSRFALTDLTSLNANVMYELGARHRADAREPPSSANSVPRFPSTSTRSKRVRTSTSRNRRLRSRRS